MISLGCITFIRVYSRKKRKLIKILDRIFSVMEKLEPRHVDVLFGRIIPLILQGNLFGSNSNLSEIILLFYSSSITYRCIYVHI